jgi:hypothetical protein
MIGYNMIHKSMRQSIIYNTSIDKMHMGVLKKLCT